MALLSIFVVGCVAWVTVSSALFTHVAGFLGEGPFSMTIDNRSEESLRVTTTQVGASSGVEHDLQPGMSVTPDWSGCATTHVVVELRGLPDRVVSSRRLDVCEGDLVVIDDELGAAVE